MTTTGENISKYKPIDKLRYIRDVLPYIDKHLAEELEPGQIASGTLFQQVSYTGIFMPAQAIL